MHKGHLYTEVALLATFIALYRGDRIDTAKLVAMTANPDTVQRFASELPNDPLYHEGEASQDPVLSALRSGKRKALRLAAGGNLNLSCPSSMTTRPTLADNDQTEQTD